MTRILVDARGASGAVHKFEVYPLGTHFHELPGLYVFCFPGRVQGDWTALYVGQTHDLQARVGSGLASHHQYSAAKAAGATHIGVALFPGREADRLAAERDLIAGMSPSLNATGFGGLLGGIG